MNTAIKRKNDNSPQRPPRSRDFVLLVAGQGISLFGNMMLRFAMSMWVLDETGSATIFASILAVSIVPTILLSPFGGVLADRVNRRTIMVALDAISATLVLASAIVFATAGFNIAAIATCRCCSPYSARSRRRPYRPRSPRCSGSTALPLCAKAWP